MSQHKKRRRGKHKGLHLDSSPLTGNPPMKWLRAMLGDNFNPDSPVSAEVKTEIAIRRATFGDELDIDVIRAAVKMYDILETENHLYVYDKNAAPGPKKHTKETWMLRVEQGFISKNIPARWEELLDNMWEEWVVIMKEHGNDAKFLREYAQALEFIKQPSAPLHRFLLILNARHAAYGIPWPLTVEVLIERAKASGITVERRSVIRVCKELNIKPHPGPKGRPQKTGKEIYNA